LHTSKSGNNERALEDFNHTLQLVPYDVEALYYRGMSKRAAGDVSGGEADLATAKQLDPGYAP